MNKAKYSILLGKQEQALWFCFEVSFGRLCSVDCFAELGSILVFFCVAAL